MGLVGLLDPGGFEIFEDELGEGLFLEESGGPACCDDHGSRQVSYLIADS